MPSQFPLAIIAERVFKSKDNKREQEIKAKIIS